MKIPAVLTRAVGKQALTIQKHSPHILFGVGVVGVVTSAVLACRATLKLSDTLDEFKAEIDDCKKEYYNPQVLSHREYTLADNRKDLTYIYVRGTANIAKLYAPAVVVGTVSIAALTGSHVTLARRNAALAAAYTTLSETFRKYRDRVREEVGEDKERELYVGAPIELNKKTGESVVRLTDPAYKTSEYARWFDHTNPNWHQTAEYNREYIRLQLLHLNDTLKARGHVFLNEVYDELGLTHTPTGAVTGWMFPAREGCDGEIVCNIYATHQEFMFGNEYALLLDFNVDPGVIWNKLEG